MSSPADAPRYCPYYCEENVWHLCAHPRVADAERKVLIISNRIHRVAMWGQRAAPAPDRPIAWDYHVVLLARRPGQAWAAWDLDASEADLRPASAWLDASFANIGLLPPIYTPRFRLIDCAAYRLHLRSDRRHMRDATGRFRVPSPPWPAIVGTPVPGFVDDGSNLERFIDVDDTRFLGELLGLAELRARLAG